MRSPAFEIISVPRPQDPPLALDRDLQPSAQDDAALLALVREGNLAGICARFVAFLQDLERAPEQVVADLAVGNLALSDLDQFIPAIEGLLRLLRLQRKELRY
jgi:hypothetical protein